MNTRKPDKMQDLSAWLGLPDDPDFTKARPLGRIIGWGGVLLYSAIVLTLAIGLFAVIGATLARFLDSQSTTDWEGYRWFLLTIATLTATLGAAIALPLTALRTRYAQRQTIASEQKLVTARINEAVEGLGAEKVVKVVERESDGSTRVVKKSEPNIEVRVAAILSLERISPSNPADYVHIIETLCAYVRENACIVPVREEPLGPEDWKQRTDVQLALTVIGRRDVEWIEWEAAEQYVLNLRGAYLKLADLSGGRWRRTDFTGTTLSQAMLVDADLRNAALWYANLQDANIRGAYLNSALLGGANLQGAQLSEADLHRAALQGANLRKTKLVETELVEADLSGASLNFADLLDCGLEEAFLESADFSECDNLVQEAVNGAFGVKSGTKLTKLPEGLTYPSHWYEEREAYESIADEMLAATNSYWEWKKASQTQDEME